MSVAFEMIDAPYPYLCAVYRCRCGAAEVRHGDQAAVPPPGWHVDRGADGEPDAVCAHCVAAAAAG
ncbi:MAG TPA: hypothetical protein VGD37_08915 [Kofleriaceae bacterium]|jgi:hypothetical protein